MYSMSSLRDRLFRSEEVPVLDFHIVARNCIELESRLAESRAAMILPVVPRARDVLTVESAVGKRTTGVIAGS
jgi:hypothetical protein